MDAKRIDPDYYAPAHLADEMKIRALGAIELGTVGRLFAGPFGSELPTSVFLNEGVPLFRVGNVGEMAVEVQDLARISPRLHTELAASEVLPGDLLLVKASVGEKLCIVPANMPHANITQHIIGLRPNGTADVGFVASVLFSGYGRRQLQRRALGAIIQYLGVQEARTVLLPRLDPDAQKYIGSKVRQSEALRERACAVAKRLSILMAALFPEPGDAGNICCSWRLGPDVLEDRLDPKYSNPRAIRARLALQSGRTRSLAELGVVISNGFEHRVFTAEGRPYITVTNVDKGCLRTNVAPRISMSVRVPDGARIGPRSVLVVRTGTIGQALLPLAEDEDAALSSHLVRLQFDTRDVAAAVASFLSSSTGVVLQQAAAYGAVQPQISQDAILDIRIPESFVSCGVELNQLWIERARALRTAERLVDAARSLVEAFIERKITEREINNAARDPATDKALLGRLTSKGLDGSGDPLFPDVDAHLALIADVGAVP